MTTGKFYRLASFLPFAIPAAAAVIVGPFWITDSPRIYDSELIAVLLFIAYTGLWSTIPYAAFVGVVRFRMRRRILSASEMRLLAWTAPLIITALIVVAWLIRGLVINDLSGGLVVGMSVGVFAIPVGYAYVAVIEATRLVGQSLGIIKDQPTGSGA